MPSSTILINASRGEVIDNRALLQALKNRHIQDAVLDVWENEPAINWDLAKAVAIATPHIAGYSFDGKIKGTTMIYQAACEYFNLTPTWKFTDRREQVSPLGEAIDGRGKTLEDLLLEIAPQLYDLHGDDSRMRSLFSHSLSDRAIGFDQLRKHYPIRREFYTTPVRLQRASPVVLARLSDLGISINPVEK